MQLGLRVFFIIKRIKFENTMRTDQKTLEQISEQRSKTLNRIEQRLHDFIEVGANWYWEPEENLCHSYLSASFETNTGMPATQFVAKNHAENQPPDVDDGLWNNLIKDMGLHRETYEFRHTRIRPNGSEIWISITASTLFDKTHKFYYILWCCKVCNRTCREDGSSSAYLTTAERGC